MQQRKDKSLNPCGGWGTGHLRQALLFIFSLGCRTKKTTTTLSWFHWPSLKRVPQMLPSQEGSDITSRTNKAPTAVRDSIVNSLPEGEIETSNSKIQLSMVVGSSPMCFTKTKRWMESVPGRYSIDPVLFRYLGETLSVYEYVYRNINYKQQ